VPRTPREKDSCPGWQCLELRGKGDNCPEVAVPRTPRERDICPGVVVPSTPVLRGVYPGVAAQSGMMTDKNKLSKEFIKEKKS
jgi:hypothetical protein